MKVLTRLLNNTTKSTERSLPLMFSSIMSHPQFKCSHDFSMIFVIPARKALFKRTFPEGNAYENNIEEKIFKGKLQIINIFTY